MKSTPLSHPDQRSQRFILVPFCLICQAFQAKGIVRFGFSSVIKPVLDEILDNDLNIIQMPCPESMLGGYSQGLSREPKGIKAYNNPEFLQICEKIAQEVTIMIEGILSNGYEIVAILGMEYSPSCSINLQYSEKGTTHQPGHFISALQKKLDGKKIEIPFIGINRRGLGPTIKRIKDALHGENQRNLF